MFLVEAEGSNVNQSGDLNKCTEECDEIDEIVEVLMQDLPSFLGINYEVWETKMKTILWKVYLLNYVEEDFLSLNHDMSRDT